MEPNTGENLLAFPSGGTGDLEIGSQWIPSGTESDSSNLLNFPEADEGAFLSPQFREPSLPQYRLPPLLSIGLDLLPSSDSGASNTDNITNDSTPTFAADLLTGSPVGVAKVQLYANGQFVGETTRRNSTQITSITLRDGPHVLVARALNLAGSVLASSAPLTVTIDTSAPSLSLTAPIAGWAHSYTARLIGSASDTGGGVPNIKYSLDGGSSSPVPVSAAGQFDAAIAASGLGLGDHNIGVIATDTAGNQASQSVDFSVTENFLIRKQGSTGWAAETANSIILHERDSWLTETAIPIELGPTSGSRTLEFELDAQFDTTDKTSLTEDRFQVWLVDTVSPHSTLLDGHTPGKVLFSLAGDEAEFTPGQVRYNGSRVSIDLTGLQEIPTGFLLLRMINGDTDTGSAVSVKNLTDTTDPEGVASPIFPVQEKKATIGPALNIGNLTQTQALEVNLSDVRLNSATGLYTAALQVINNGPATSRNVAVSFANLPAGVQLQNASGVDAAGFPYINLRNAIQPGGLDAGARSAPVEVIFSNPNFSVVPVITSVFVGAPNTAPNFAPVGALTVKPGERLEIPLSATDANGDKVIYSIRSDSRLPKGKITGNGQLIFTPAPDDVGTYNFTLVASDGALETPQEVTLTVAADPVTTTRVSGVIENTAQEPLAGVIIELGSLQTVTAADGSFILETPGALPDNTLKVRGEGISGNVTYPFIAEKLPLLLEHEVYTGVKNVISRPIYLPPIDMANAETIEPAADVTVTTSNIPGASVFVAAGSLKDHQGNPYTGQLSITEVPAELTPAALPSNLHPDVVVTIQPGEMVFTTPAPLSLPNRAGYAPGTLMDLWSINPTTGLFDNVGTGKVSEDGSVIETISGGIRNSSWHFFGAQPQDANQDERNPDEGGNECKENCNFTSVAELHSGAVMETHNLVSYQSLGAMRGLQLTYDSLRADPRPILHFGYDNTVPNPQGRLIADLTVSRGSFEYQLSGFEGGNYGLKGGEHFWEIPETGGKIDAALQADMRSLISGEYDYSLNSGVYLFDGEAIFGSSTESQGKILSVNTINSPWGSGWGLAGLQKLVENPNGSVLLIDGDGSELLFEASPLATGAYMSPPGDFSTLERLADGTFRRTMKDETVYSFNGHNKLALVTERNGNETRYVYNGSEKLAKIIDPVGLETTFSYNGGKVSAITDPAGRITRLEYDAAGNLTRIVDPDGSARTWEYDSEHHIIAEVDKRNNREETFYDFAGRALSATQKDGKSLKVAPVQVAGLYRSEETIDPFNAPVALVLGDAESSQADGNGNVKSTILDSAGQAVSARDGGGFLPSVERNESNLVTDRTNGRGQVTEYEYDAKGNVISISDEISGASEPPTGNTGELFALGEDYLAGVNPVSVAVSDIDGDSDFDVITANSSSNSVSVLQGNGDGTFSPNSEYAVKLAPLSVATGDVNRDGFQDAVVAGFGLAYGFDSDYYSVLLGDGEGNFTVTDYEVALGSEFVALEDLNGDGNLDMVTTSAALNRVSVRLGNGDGTFAPETDYSVGSLPVGVAIGDVDGDGEFDIVSANSNSNNLSVLLGDGSGSFVAGSEVAFGVGISAAILSDLDSDGDSDIIGANRFTNKVSVRLGSGNGTFGSQTDYTVGAEPVALAVGDADGNGKKDIAIANRYDSKVSVILGQGDGTFVAGNDVAVSYGPASVALADLDFDGDKDLVTGNSFSNNVSVRLNTTNSVGGGGAGKRSYTYDPIFNQVTSVTDELGRQTLYEIDTLTGNTLSETRVVGEVGGGDDAITRYTYTSKNLIDTETDPLGRLTDYDYDNFGRLVEVTFAKGTPDEAVQRMEYDAAGNQTAMIDENGNRTEYEYDAMNRLVKTTFAKATPDEASQRMEYDDAGNQTAMIDENGNRTEYEYDVMNQLVRMVEADPDGSGPQTKPVTSYSYDQSGNQVLVVDPLGRKTENRYDSRNRLIETIDPLDNRTKFRYDFDNNMTSVIDPIGNRTNMVYEARGRLIREFDPLNKATVYEYNAADNLVAQTDRNNRRTEFEYDDLERLATETWAGSDGVVRYGYDKASNLTSISDSFSTLAFMYDSRNRVKTVNNAGTPGAPNVLLNYLYDRAGNVDLMTDTINGQVAGNNDYAYDARNRLTQMSQSGSGVSNKRVNFTYNGVGQLSSINRSADLNGTQLVAGTTYTYDGLNRLTNLSHRNPANNVISFFGFKYDTASRITQIADLDGTADYTYDDRDQLTGANHGNSNNPDESYSYDGNGNRLSSSVHGSGYVTGANNRLQTDGIYNYQYDDEGNLIRRTEIATGKVREFEWDYRNRLVGVVDKDAANAVIQQVAFTYDAMDRRIAKSVNGAVTHFVYDGDNVLLDFVDSDGTAGPNQPVLDRRYLHGPVVDQVLAQDGGAGNVVWHLADHLGTVRDLANSSGAVVSHLTYDSFGNVIAQTNGTIKTRYLFTGREFDEETGLHYYRARYYNGTVGRFLSEDPIGFAGGDTNLYRYVGNSPLNATDPTGLQLLFSPGPLLGPGLRQILPLFPGAEEYNNINQPSNWHPRFGDCTKNDWYVLQREVSDKCKGPNSDRTCVDGMSTAEALANKAKFEACAEARRIINETCYRGGDPAHLGAIKQALNGAKKCEEIANACSP